MTIRKTTMTGAAHARATTDDEEPREAHCDTALASRTPTFRRASFDRFRNERAIKLKKNCKNTEKAEI